MKNLTLVIPAKYESESLPHVLEVLKVYDLHINIVLKENDQKTIDSIKNFDVKIVFQKNEGYGDALIEGLSKVETEYFCIFNADGSFNPKELLIMHSKINNEKFDLIFGTRYEQNSGSDDDTNITYIGNQIFSLIGKIFFSLPITDVLYTYVMGDTKKVKKLNLLEKDFSFCVELPIKAKKSNLSMATSPSNERKRIAGKKKVNEFKDGFKILISMIKLFFK